MGALGWGATTTCGGGDVGPGPMPKGSPEPGSAPMGPAGAGDGSGPVAMVVGIWRGTVKGLGASVVGPVEGCWMG